MASALPCESLGHVTRSGSCPGGRGTLGHSLPAHTSEALNIITQEVESASELETHRNWLGA